MNIQVTVSRRGSLVCLWCGPKSRQGRGRTESLLKKQAVYFRLMLKNRKQDKVYWDKSKLETKLGAARLTMKTKT